MNPKRERGLKQLPDGRWQFSWKYQGKYHRFKANTKTEARAQRERIKTEIRAGKYRDPQRATRITFEKAVEKFLTWTETANRPSTAKNDAWVAGFMTASPHFAGKLLDHVNGSDVELFKQTLAKAPRRPSQPGIRHLSAGTWRLSWSVGGHYHRKTFKDEAAARAALAQIALDRKKGTPDREAPVVSKRTVDVVMARLKRLFSLCVEWGLLERSPAERVKLFREDVMRVRYLSEEEEDLLLGAASPHLCRIITVALNTGMRKGELMGLRWQDVDLKNGVAYIPATRAKGKRDRRIHLNAPAVAALEELARPIDSTELVFNSLTGGPHGNLERLWRRALAASDLQDFHFHDLRHTFASRLVMAGVDLNTVRELLGHTNLIMTLRYAHLAPSRLKEAVRILAIPRLHEKVHAEG